MNRKALASLPESGTDVWSSDCPGVDVSNHSRLRKVKKVLHGERVLPGDPGGVPGEVPGGTPARRGAGVPGSPRTRATSPWHLKTNCYKLRMSRNSRDIAMFRDYLEFTGKLTIDLTLYDMEKRETVILHLPYTHRWHAKYRNRTLARFYKFNEWWLEQGRPPLTLLTLTTYQDGAHSRDQVGGYTIEESFEVLKTSWDKLRKMLRNRILCCPFDYLWTMEPHETGYPHLHVAIVAEFEDWQKEKTKTLWNGYRAGSYEHGAHFEDSCLDAKGDIKNAGFYLFKYLGKGFCIDPEQMSPGELRFNAQLWKHGWRQWGASRGISKAMKLDSRDSDRFRFLEAGVSMTGWETTFREATAEQKQAIRDELEQMRHNYELL